VRRPILLIILVLLLLCVGLFAWLSLGEHRALEAHSEVYNGLRVSLELSKTAFKISEELEIKVKIVNLGNEPVTIHHGYPLLFVAIYDTATGERIRTYPPVVLDVLITTTLQPGEEKSTTYKITFDKPGDYALAGLASFSLPDKEEVSIETDKIVVKVKTGS
jgi:hypothetical protein